MISMYDNKKITKLRPYQQAIIDDKENNHLLIWPRRYGKDLTVCAAAYLNQTKSNEYHLIYDQFVKFQFNHQPKYINKNNVNVKVYRPNTDREMEQIPESIKTISFSDVEPIFILKYLKNEAPFNRFNFHPNVKTIIAATPTLNTKEYIEIYNMVNKKKNWKISHLSVDDFQVFNKEELDLAKENDGKEFYASFYPLKDINNQNKKQGRE